MSGGRHAHTLPLQCSVLKAEYLMWCRCRVQELSGGCRINATAAKTRRPLHRESVAVRVRLKIKGFCEREDTPPSTVCDVHARAPSPTRKCYVVVSTAGGRHCRARVYLSPAKAWTSIPRQRPAASQTRTCLHPVPHEAEQTTRRCLRAHLAQQA